MVERLGEMRKGSWNSSIKICFYKLIESIILKMSWCETECKKKCAIGETECNET